MDEDLGALAFAAAQTMVGVPFRPQGRDRLTGLDCVGLVWASYAAAGAMLRAPVGYPLRGWSRERIVVAIEAAGFSRVDDRREGDVALIALAAGQLHLGMLGPASFVHAHAGLRRVVETPLDPAILAAHRWRLSPARCD